jgi:hypothetical protein
VEQILSVLAHQAKDMLVVKDMLAMEIHNQLAVGVALAQ